MTAPPETRERVTHLSPRPHVTRPVATSAHDMRKSKQLGEPSPAIAPPPSFLEAAASGDGPWHDAAPFQTRFACVTLNRADRMRFINLSAREFGYLRGVLGSVWPMQDVRIFGGADEIKFKAYPWDPRVNGDDQARRLVRRMLEELYDMGWVLQAAVDASRKEMDKGMTALGRQL
jgi:hypothetical protein